MKWVLSLILILSGYAGAVSLAVLDFEAPGDEIPTGDIDAMHSSIISSLTDFGIYRLVDRNQLDKILAEHKLSMSGLVNLENAVKVGNLVGADYLLTGGINAVGGEVELKLQMVDVEGGSIKAYGTVTAEDYAMLRDKAPLALYDLLGDIRISGEVIEAVEGTIIYVAAGQLEGVLPGMKVIVYRDELKGNVTVPVDILPGKVSEVGADWSKIEIDNADVGKAKAGDLVSFNLAEFYAKQSEIGLNLILSGTRVVGETAETIGFSEVATKWFTEGNTYFNSGDYKSARDAYDRALKMEPKYIAALRNKGDAYYNEGEYKDAIGCYDKGLELDSGDKMLLYNRGYAYFNLGDYRKALEDIESAIDVAPRFADAYRVQSELLDILGQRDLAKQAMKKYKELK